MRSIRIEGPRRIGDGVQSGRGLRMGRSRLGWAGSVVAPWVIALGLLVSITAQAGQEPGWTGGFVAQGARPDRPSPLRQALVASTFGLARSAASKGDKSPILEASLTVGAPEDLGAIADEIEPNGAVKQGQGNFPAIDRTRKGDPFIILRPGFDAHLQRRAPSGERGAGSWAEDSRSPAAILADAEAAASLPQPQFGDGATPAAPLEFALNSSTPTPSDGAVIVAAARAGAQTTAPSRSDAGGRPDYAALIDPKDAARQMQCLA